MKHLSEKCGLLILRTSTFCTDHSNKWKSRSSTDGISDLSYQECVLVGIGAGKRDKKGKTTALTTDNLANPPPSLSVSFICILFTAAFLPSSRVELLQ